MFRTERDESKLFRHKTETGSSIRFECNKTLTFYSRITVNDTIFHHDTLFEYNTKFKHLFFFSLFFFRLDDVCCINVVCCRFLLLNTSMYIYMRTCTQTHTHTHTQRRPHKIDGCFRYYCYYYYFVFSSCALCAWYTQSRLISRKASDVRDSYIDLSVPYTHGFLV